MIARFFKVDYLPLVYSTARRAGILEGSPRLESAANVSDEDVPN